MDMEALQPDQAKAFLNSVRYLEPMLDMGEKAVRFGIDSIGREFILITSQITDIVKLGFY